MENIQLKKTVNELKQILNSCRSSIDISAENSNVIDDFLAREFYTWQEHPSLKRDFSLFMHRIYNEDILPCLTFPNADVRTNIHRSFLFYRLIILVVRENSLVHRKQSCHYRSLSFQGEYQVNLNR